MAPPRTPSNRPPSDSVYHIKQTVDVTADGITFSFYELNGTKKISYNGRKMPQGNYSIFEKLGDKLQTYENLSEEDFLKKIAAVPHLKLINEQIGNKKKKGLKRALSLSRTASKKRSRKTSKKNSKKGSKKAVRRLSRAKPRKTSKKARSRKSRSRK